jgi:hypothetical protein
VAGDRRVRAAVVVAGVLLGGAGLPGSARADSGPGSDSRYYVTELSAVRPPMAGLKVEVTRTGEWVRVTNTSTTPVTVLGYTDEPYLRLSPTGTEENQSSLSTYLNDSLVISQVPPDWTVKPVQWKKVSAAPAYSWHDHRVHWMSSTRPPIVANDPEHPHPVSNWTIRMLYGDVPVTVTGTLSWSGRPSQFGSVASRVVWGVGIVALLIVAWRLGLIERSRRSRRAQDGMAPAA